MGCVKWGGDGEQGCIGGGIADEGGGQHLSASSVANFFHRVFLIDAQKLQRNPHVLWVFLGDFKNSFCLGFGVVNVEIGGHFSIPQSEPIHKSDGGENPAPVVKFHLH